MFKLSVNEFTDTKVHTIAIGNRRLFWVKMCNLQNRLGVENIHDF